VGSVLAGAPPDPLFPFFPPRWEQFIRTHLDVVAPLDFFSGELPTRLGLVRYMALFAIDIASRRVQIAGVKTDPDGEWMKQVAGNLTFAADEFLSGKPYLIHDRDPLFTEAFGDVLKAGGVKPVKLPGRPPDLNPYAERLVQTVKHEYLDRVILTGQAQLEYAPWEFPAYYHHESPQQGLRGHMTNPYAQDLINGDGWDKRATLFACCRAQSNLL